MPLSLKAALGRIRDKPPASKGQGLFEAAADASSIDLILMAIFQGFLLFFFVAFALSYMGFGFGLADGLFGHVKLAAVVAGFLVLIPSAFIILNLGFLRLLERHKNKVFVWIIILALLFMVGDTLITGSAYEGWYVRARCEGILTVDWLLGSFMLFDDNYVGGTCYQEFALKSEKAGYCEYLSGYERDKCLVATAKKSGDITTCLLVSGQYERDACIRSVGEAAGSRDYCDMLSKNDNFCYLHLAEETGDPGVCLKAGELSDVCLIDTLSGIPDCSQSFECIGGFNDTGICARQDNPEVVERCLYWVSKNQ